MNLNPASASKSPRPSKSTTAARAPRSAPLVTAKKAAKTVVVEPPSDNPIDLRLARIEGQVAGIRKMARDKRSCIDILTQLSAIQSALDQVKIIVLTHHLGECAQGEGCLADAVVESMSRDDQQKEMKVALNRFVK